MDKTMNMLCKNCGYVGKPEKRGSVLVTFFLLLFFIVPGMLYALLHRKPCCPMCRNPYMVPVNPEAPKQSGNNADRILIGLAAFVMLVVAVNVVRIVMALF